MLQMVHKEGGFEFCSHNPRGHKKEQSYAPTLCFTILVVQKEFEVRNISHITGPNTFAVLTDANIMEAVDKLVGKRNGSGGEYNWNTSTHFREDAQWIQHTSLEKGVTQGTLSRNPKAKHGQLGPLLTQPSYRQPALATPLQKLNQHHLQDAKGKQNRTLCSLSYKSHLLSQYSTNHLQEQ